MVTKEDKQLDLDKDLKEILAKIEDADEDLYNKLLSSNVFTGSFLDHKDALYAYCESIYNLLIITSEKNRMVVWTYNAVISETPINQDDVDGCIHAAKTVKADKEILMLAVERAADIVNAIIMESEINK